MRSLVVALAIGLVPALASASPRTPERYAIAVNEPLFWANKIIGVSAYVAVDQHHALRVNVANYTAPGTQLSALFAAPSGGTPINGGGYFDVGFGWQWYLDGLWRGPTFELGVLWRADHRRFPDSFDTMPEFEVERDARGVLARGLVGWSWLFYDRLFIMAAAGSALGYERGTELVTLDDYTTRYTRPSPSLVATLEGYARVGWTF
jgi:hypothetical protein